MSVIFANPAGTAVGLPVLNTKQVNVVSITAMKTSNPPGVTLSNIAKGLGGTSNGPPGSLSEYMGGLGLVTGLSGSFSDSLSVKGGKGIVADKYGVFNTIDIHGIAFHRVVQASSSGNSCDTLAGNGIERILAYFQDNRMSQSNKRWTVVKIGTTKIYGSVLSVQFSMLDTQYNIWKWTIRILTEQDIITGNV